MSIKFQKNVDKLASKPYGIRPRLLLSINKSRMCQFNCWQMRWTWMNLHPRNASFSGNFRDFCQFRSSQRPAQWRQACGALDLLLGCMYKVHEHIRTVAPIAQVWPQRQKHRSDRVLPNEARFSYCLIWVLYTAFGHIRLRERALFRDGLIFMKFNLPAT